MIKIEPEIYNHFELTQNSQNSPEISFQDISLYRFNDQTHFRRFFLETHMIYYIRSGRLNITINDEEVLLEKNDILHISPYCYVQNHTLPSDENTDTVEFFALEFSCSGLGLSAGEQYMKFSNTEYNDPLFSELYYESRTSNMQPVCDARLLLIIYKLINITGNTGDDTRLAEKTRLYILNNITRPLTISEVSLKMNHNKDYLCRIFKKEYGIPIKSFIDNERINYTKRLLKTSDLPIESIAKLLGWDDTNLFLKYFKYHEGITPSRYRQITVN